MKNPIRVRTNQVNDRFFDVYLYNDRRMFQDDEDEIMRDEDVDIMYSGPSAHLPQQLGKIDVGSKVTFREEGTPDKLRHGKVVSFKTTPFIEVEEDETGYRYGVHRKYIKSADPTFKELSELYIQRLGKYQFRKYDLGAVKIKAKTFMTAEESLADLSSKGMYIIMTVTQV